MAEELNKESAEDFDELIAERDQLQATVKERTQEVDTLRAEIDNGKTDIEAQLARLAELETTVTQSRTETAHHQRAAEEQMARASTVEKELDTVRQASQLDAVRLEELTTTAEDMKSSSTESGRQMLDLVLEIVCQRQRLHMATRAWRKASAGLSIRTTALDVASARIDELTAKVDAFDAERSAMSEQLASYNERARSLDTANEKVKDLEGQLATLQEECVAMSEQLDEKIETEAKLSSRLADSNNDLQAREESARRIDELGAELSVAREDAQRLEADMADVRAELVASHETKAQLETTLIEQLGLAKTDLADSQTKLTSKEAELAEVTERIRSYHAESELTATTVTEQLTTVVDGLRNELETAKANLQDTVTQLGASNAKISEVEEEITKARENKDAEVAAARTEMEATDTARDLAIARATGLESKIVELQSTIQGLETQLQDAAASSTDRTLALQSSNAELQVRLESTVAQADQLRSDIETITNQKARLSDEIVSLTAELNDTKAASTSGQIERERLEERVVGLEREAKDRDILLTNKASVIQKS